MSKNHAFIFVATVCGSALCLGQLRLAAYIDIAPGEYKTGSLAAGEMHTYRFTASAGDSVTVLMGQIGDEYGETFEPHVELHAPDGSVLAVNSGSDSATIQSVKIPQRGTCFVLAREKDGFDAGDYGLSLVKNPGSVTVNDPNGGPIQPGEYKKGRIEAGDIDAYTFVASAGDSVTILMAQSSRAYDYGEVFEPHVELHGPDGTVLATNSGSDSATIQSVKVPQGGTCFILAREKDGFDVGDYGLSLVKNPGTVTVNDPNGGSINPGEYKKGRIEAGDIDAYSFAASAGDSVTVLMGQSSHAYDYGETFEPYVELHAPDGTVLAVDSGPDAATIQAVKIPQRGTCFVLAREKDGFDAGDYGLSLVKNPGTVMVDDPNGGSVNPGEYKKGRIEPGDIDAYTFTASAGDSVTVLMSQIGDEYGETFEPHVELHAPDGSVLAVNSGSDSATIQSVRVPQKGTCFILAREKGGFDAWDYALSLVKIPGTVTVNDPNGGSINPGEYKKGRIEPGDMDAYTFAASAGDSVTILMSQSSHAYDYGETFEPRIELYAPDGTVVDVNSGPDSATIQSARIPQKGVCFIIAREKDGSDVGDYGLSLLKVPGTAHCATVEPGEYKRGRIEPGQIDVYAFTASAGDSMTILAGQIGVQYGETFEPRIELHAPDGTVLATSSGPQSATIQSVKGPQCGTYYVAVRAADGLDTGDYGLSLSGRITPGICGDLNEVSFNEATLVETVCAEKWTLRNGNIVGDLNGVFALNEFELVAIETGPWTGKGFSRALCEATFEGATYMGEWQGIAFFDPNATEIRLKGSIDGEILATVEGTLTESIPGSGAYDHYQATWKIGRLDSVVASATVNTSGILTDQSRLEYPSTGLYVLQTAMDGNLPDDLGGPLNTVVNHVRIADANNPYNRCGFSIISYVCRSGSGQGYTCDELDPAGALTMRGLFTDPLYGVVSATLNETTVPRQLHLALQRVDLGLPPVADLEVDLSTPGRVSPGQTFNYLIEYRNQGLMTASDTVVVTHLPYDVDYVSSSGSADYRPTSQEVLWRLDDVPPWSKAYLHVTVTAKWGLPRGTRLDAVVLAGTSSPEKDVSSEPNTLPLDLQRYLEPVHRELDDAEFMDNVQWRQLLSSDPRLEDTYLFAEELGATDMSMPVRLRFTDGTEHIVVPMNSAVPGEILLLVGLSSPQGASFLMRFDDTAISLLNRRAGLSYIGAIDPFMFWDAPGGCTLAQCLEDCLAIKFGKWLGEQAIQQLLKKLLGGMWHILWSGPPCAVWLSSWNCCNNQQCPVGATPELACREMPGALVTCLKSLPFVGEIVEVEDCFVECWFDKNAYANPDGTCGLPIPPINGDGDGPIVTPAHDPNRKFGPQGNVTAGQKLDFKVEYENEGEGIAFGVYLTDTLDDDLDDSTLEIGPVNDVATGVQIAPPGHYDPATRTITWFVGQVDPNQGGYAELRVNVKSGATNGTEIINFATVYFPSVPEATRTNAIVSTVPTDRCVAGNHAPVVNAEADVTVEEGQPLIRTGSFVDDDAGDSWLGMVEYGDGSSPQALQFEGRTYTLRHTYADNGVYPVTVIATDSCGESGTGRFVVEVNNVAPTVSARIASQDVQYSDPIKGVVFTATDVPADTMVASFSWSTDGGKTFATKMTTPPTLVPPDDKTIPGGLAFTGDIVQTGSGTWTLAGLADLRPGTYIIRLTVSDEDGASASVDTTINVTREDALATYVGSEIVSTPSATDSVATVELWALIQDITAVNPASDPNTGNVTKATVTFVNRDDGAVIAEGVRVMLLDPEDLTAGLARYKWLVDLGPQNSASFTVGMIVEEYYTRDSSADNTVVTVSRPGM